MNFDDWIKVCESAGHEINEPETAYAEMLPLIEDFTKEYFIVLSLNSKNKIIARQVISIGSLNQTIVHPREVFKFAIMNSACSIVVGHNHPSGDPVPGPEDIKLTNRLKDVGKMLDIPLLDHIIIGNNQHCSMKEARHILFFGAG